MFDPPPGLVFSSLGVRVRQLAEGPDNALATRRELFEAVDLYYSDFRDAFLAGDVKQVGNWLRANEVSIFSSYSIIATTAAERPAVAARNRKRLRTELRHQYKNAVIRSIASNPKNAARLRSRTNKQLDSSAPEPYQVDALFAGHPEALAAAAGIRAAIAAVG